MRLLIPAVLALSLPALDRAYAADACPPGWQWEQAKPNYSCKVDLTGLVTTEAEGRRAVTLYQDLAAIAYANCASGVSAPAGSGTVTPDGSGFRWHVTSAYSCKLPT